MGIEVISSADDEVFGQFDFNDNTPVLEPQVNKVTLFHYITKIQNVS